MRLATTLLLCIALAGCENADTLTGRSSPDSTGQVTDTSAAPSPDTIDAEPDTEAIEEIDDTDVSIDFLDGSRPEDSADAADPNDLAELSDLSDDIAAADLSEDAALFDLLEDTATPPSDTRDPTDTGPTSCESPLTLEPPSAYSHPREIVTFRAHGGSGVYRFELAEAPSGGEVHDALGIYLAGSAQDTTDRLRVHDTLCKSTAEAEIYVVPPLVLNPPSATVAPLAQLTLDIEGGSGQTLFELVENDSGATVDANGLYIAGPRTGFDRLRVTDLETLAVRESLVAVEPDAHFAISPPALALPLGARFRLSTLAGSGLFVASTDSDAIAIDGDWVTALAPGRATLTLVDRHTDETASAEVSVLAPLDFDRYPAGDGGLNGIALAPGDINGDGFPDAIVSYGEFDVGHLNAGALFIYRGVEGGLDPTPARVISGVDRSDQLGRTALVADIDSDGLSDLLVGVPFADPTGVNVGLVRIYKGVEGAFFSETATRIFIGDDPGDQFGTSLAVCDFNGDGYADLAIGAPTAEDATLAGTADSGSVLIWLGSETGFATLPDQRLYGERPNGDLWVVTASSRLGMAMASGDMDGDGLCDLAVSANDLATASGRGNDGAIWVYRGREADTFSAGGVATHPTIAWAGTDADNASARIGFSLAMGDLDGDGLADLASGQPTKTVGALANHGVVRLFRGKPFPPADTAAVFNLPSSADWTWSSGGGAGSDLLGYTVAIGDWDGVPPLDLFTTGLDDELPGGPSGGGVIYVIPGIAYATPASAYAAAFAGNSATQRFGHLFAPLGDLDDDGRSEFVVRAPTDSLLAPRYGTHQLVFGDSAKSRMQLGIPMISAGSRIGQSIAIVPDINRDGHPELVVGAPSAQGNPAIVPTIARGGVVGLHSGKPGEFDKLQIQRFEDTTSLSTTEGFGDAVLGMKDFDGDGNPDLAAMVARDSASAASCGTLRSSTGSVHLFRGKADGTFNMTPSLIYWGEQASQRIEKMATADIDGDGKSDLIIGSSLWDGPSGQTNIGALIVVRGQTLGTALVNKCTSEKVFLGALSNDLLGSAVTGIRDLDNDGCDEIGVGARGEDMAGGTNVGVVRVIFGWGPYCDSSSPRVLAFPSPSSNATAGGSLAAGDLDNDGLDDLAIGATGFTILGNAIGAVWVLTGQRIRSLLSEATPFADLTRPTLANLHRFTTDNSTLDVRVEGRLAGELFGQNVLIAAPRGRPYGALVVSSPGSDIGGTPRAGAVLVYPWTESGLASAPSIIIGGETAWPATEFGAGLAMHQPAEEHLPALLVIGAPVSRLIGLDEGAIVQYPLNALLGD